MIIKLFKPAQPVALLAKLKCSGFLTKCLIIIRNMYNFLRVLDSLNVLALAVYTLEHVCCTCTKHLVSIDKYIIFKPAC